MIGWIVGLIICCLIGDAFVSILMIIWGVVTGEPLLFIAAGLFSISASIFYNKKGDK